MNSQSVGPSVDLRAIGVGMLWGLGLLLMAALGQGVVTFRSPVAVGTELILSIIWQLAAALLSGYFAARRASGAGWLHGALSGVALILAIAAVMGVHTALPTLAAALKMAGIGTGAGALGGVVGINRG